MFYNHYAVLQGLSAPNTKAMAQLYRPEHSSADHFGYGTLTYTLNSAASPYPPAPLPAAPAGLMAQAGLSQVTLNWTPAAGDLAQGYSVLRSTTSGGPYTSIALWNANTSPNYTDTSAVNGTTYYYVVSAMNQNGAGANSAEVSATPVASALPSAWRSQDIGVVRSAGSTAYTSAGNNTFIVTGAGTGIGGTGDGGFHYTCLNATNSFTIIARLTDNNADEMGLMMRASLATNSYLVQMTMAANARQSTYGVRSASAGGNLNHYTSGDQFTTPPAWYKLTRNGSTFTAYQSADGVTWTTVQSSTVTMGSTYYAGISINNGSATFDNVVYTNAAVTRGFAPPAAPANVTATAIASNQVYLSWASVTNAAGYNVKRSLVSGSGYTTIVSNIAATAYYDTTATTNTTYYYVISAINGGGESANSPPPASATTPSASAPAAPTGLTATPGANYVDLNWAAVIGASSYNVWRSTTAGGSYTNIATGVIATFTDTNATTGKRYYYVVSAVNGLGESPYSTEASALVEANLQTYLKFDETGGTTALDSTTNGWGGTLVNGPIWVAGYSNNAVNLSSNSSQYVTLPDGVVNNLDNFSITMWVKQTTASAWPRAFDFGTGTSSYMFLCPLPGGSSAPRFACRLNNGTEQQINGVSAVSTGVWHHLAVTLNGSVGILYVDGVAVGTNSSMTLKPSSLGITTQNYIGKSQFADPYFNGLVDDFRIYNDALKAGEVATFIAPLSAPTSLKATASNNLVALKWNSAARATSYNVMRSLTNGGTYSFAASVATTNYTNTGLVNDGTTYYYVVTAMNAVGRSTNSAQVSATLPAPPNSPTGLTAVPGDAQVALGWNAASGATNYFMKSALVASGPYAIIRTNGTSLTFTNTGLSNGTVYYYVVSASNSAGESTNSPEASAQPVSTSSPQLSFGVAGAQLQFNWPADHTGWRLQVQTNSLNAGLGTNWVTVPDSTSTNQMLVPIDAVNGSVFFRLVYP